MHDSVREAVAGAFAGIITKTLVAPLDRLKLVVQLRGSLPSSTSTSTSSSSSTSKSTSTSMEVRKQIQQENQHYKNNNKNSTATSTSSIKYGGPIRALTRIIHEEGFFALWRGNTSTIFIQGGTSALNFMFLDLFKETSERIVVHILPSFISMTTTTKTTTTMKQTDNNTTVLTTQQHLMKSLLSGALAGGTTMTILYPLGIVRTKLAMDMGKEQRLYPNGMKDVVMKSYRTNGITSLFQGYNVALISVTLYRMVYLGGYDHIKYVLLERKRRQALSETNIDAKTATTFPSTAVTTSTKNGRSNKNDDDITVQVPFWERFVAAQFVSMLASTIHYPLDSVRRRLMMQSDMVAEQKVYKNAIHCFVHIYQTEGISGYFRGLGTNYIRSVGASLVLVSYDFFKSLLL